LVNKRDDHSVDIPVNFLEEKYSIAGVYTFSIQDDAEMLSNFRDQIVKQIKANPSWQKELIPIHYFNVKEELEKRFEKDEEERNQEHITKSEFDKIAEQFEVEDTEKLLGALHSLGVSLWYRNMEHFNTLVLNPEWISHGVYQIINWASGAEKYALNITDLATVFIEDRDRYPEDKDPFFFDLMSHFELAYRVKDEKEIIIPHLLNEDRPKKLPDFPIGEALMLRYCAEQPLPPHTISRFIVRHNWEIKKEGGNYLVWRYGVVLEKEKTIALVRENDRTISVSVKGPDKTNYISVLRETLNDIFNSYKSDKPELQYRVERHGQIPDEVEEQYPLWIVDRKVVGHYEGNRPYYDEITKQDISMQPTVNHYNIQAKNVALGNGTINTFNFSDCNITLQGSLNELAQLFAENGKNEEVKELEGISNALEHAKNCENQEEIKKSGIPNRLKRWLDNASDTSLTLYKAVKSIKNGVDIVQDIAKGYNDIAQWAGLPQVPKPFL